MARMICKVEIEGNSFYIFEGSRGFWYQKGKEPRPDFYTFATKDEAIDALEANWEVDKLVREKQLSRIQAIIEYESQKEAQRKQKKRK